jgi:hypothetical protein
VSFRYYNLILLYLIVYIMSYYLKCAAHNVYIVGSSPLKGKAQRREGDVAGEGKHLGKSRFYLSFISQPHQIF